MIDYIGPMKIPIDLEVERSVLGTMTHSVICLQEGLTKFTQDHFYDPFHREYYDALKELSQKGQPKLREVTRELMKRKTLNHDGIALIEQAQTSPSQFQIWTDALHDLFVRRSYILTAKKMADMARKETCSTDELMDLVEKEVMALNQMESTDAIYDPLQSAEDALEGFAERVANPMPVRGISCSRQLPSGDIDGFPGIDRALMGFAPGDLIIIAAQTGHGKTTIAQNITRHVSIHQGYYTFYQNTEMQKEEMVDKFAAQLSGVDFQKIYTGVMNDKELEKVQRAYTNYSTSKVFLSQLPNLTPQKSKALARKFKLEHGRLDLLIIDYIGRLEVEDAKGLREDQVLSRIAKETKKLAQELQCAVILLSQLTEEGKVEGARRIRNDADAVFFLEPATEEERKEHTRATHKLIKNKVRRGGQEGVIWLHFNRPKLYMTEVI